MSLLELNKAEFVTSYGVTSKLPTDSNPEIVFSGRSNVGKSSLINKLCNRKNLARVSSTPGKTATINFYSAGEVMLVDLPGYGYAKVSNAERARWDKLINGYFSGASNLCVLVQLLDSRHDPSKDDMTMLGYMNYYTIPFIVALTKADKNKPSLHAKILEHFEEITRPFGCKKVFLTSAGKGSGIPELAEYLREFIEEF